MRCTKCSYLSFEPEPRCRNCGHDLSIDDLSLGEIPLRETASGGDPLDEFDLHLDIQEPEPAPVSLHRSMMSREDAGGVATMTPPVMAKPVARVAPAPAPVAAAPVMAAPVVATPMTAELPLFVRDMVQDDEEDLAPLVKVPPRPRPPLAVRRTTPDPAKLRARYATPQEPSLLDSITDLTEAPVRPTPMHNEPPLWQYEPSEETAAASPTTALPTPIAAGQRIAAAAIDAGVLGVIAVTTVVCTLRLAELPLAGVLELPLFPMAAFLALIGLGYELMFTAASGQTIGKMIMGLRVVPDAPHAEAERVSIRQAFVRALSMLPLGAGLVAAFVGYGLAVHDRVAHTRVVRV